MHGLDCRWEHGVIGTQEGSVVIVTQSLLVGLDARPRLSHYLFFR
ncbi:hypothetical protein Rcae01_06250 [Novipirellula caenicola]|uniref:Uncharacterized protein n=1 Tax=Novipirellula caenicola TaxID=1536901 RepID=A0ABP9W2K1_9BACT